MEQPPDPAQVAQTLLEQFDSAFVAIFDGRDFKLYWNNVTPSQIAAMAAYLQAFSAHAFNQGFQKEAQGESGGPGSTTKD